MNIKTFIEKAIEGGWKPFEDEKVKKHFELEHEREMIVFYTRVNVRRFGVHEMLLDPLAWQAVGKVEGWKSGDCELCGHQHPTNDLDMESVGNHGHLPKQEYRDRMHRFIDNLCDGKTLEEALDEATT